MKIRRRLLLYIQVIGGIMLIMLPVLIFDNQTNGDTDFIFKFGGIAIMLVGIAFLLRDRNADSSFRIFTHYTGGNGWKPDLITDAVILLPDHIFSLSKLGSTSTVSVVHQNVAFRETETGREILAFCQIGEADNSANTSFAGQPVPSRSIVFVSRTLPGLLPGWVKMVPSGREASELFGDLELESNEFNDEVNLRADPERLGTYFGSPNVMNWYLNQSIKTFLHAEKNTICILHAGKLDYDDLDRMTQQLSEVSKLVERSGALEK